jgi:putative transposase
MLLTYRYRLLPTRAQHARLADILESQRQLYNHALAERIDAYERTCLEVERGLRKKPLSISYFDQANSLTILGRDPLTRDEFNKVPKLLQHWTLKRLDDAYSAFFRRIKAGTEKPGFPRFRGKEFWSSFGAALVGSAPISFDGRRVRIGARTCNLRIRVHMDRPLPNDAVIRSVVFTRAPGGRKWYVSFQCVRRHRSDISGNTNRQPALPAVIR